MHVALGGSAHATETFRVADFMAYYRMAKREFEATIAAPATQYPPPNTYPEPVEHCDVCRWDPVCSARRRSDDDLALVAGITGRQRRALKDSDLKTRRGLAALPTPLTTPFDRLDGVSPDSLLRVREQARIQVEGEDRHEPVHELIPPARTRDGGFVPNLGLLGLPEPRPGDLFFDIEGDPFANDDGLDYLFGVLEPGLPDPNAPDAAPGKPGRTFHAFWARDADGRVTPEAEKRAFEQTVDLFMDRLAKDPTIHIYHYAAYEQTALGRLMGRHATREDDVDRLKRGGVLVDLFRAVRQGVRASVESYSIKKLEPFYGFEREIDLRDAGSSIVAFETWLETGGEAGTDEETLHRIERYNRDDVVSNVRCRDWLETLRVELAGQLGEDVPRPPVRDGLPSEGVAEASAETQALVDRLTANVPADPLERTDDEHARWLLAQLLGWHRREDKSAWWRFFHLIGELTDEERLAERDALAGLDYEGVVGTGEVLAHPPLPVPAAGALDRRRHGRPRSRDGDRRRPGRRIAGDGRVRSTTSPASSISSARSPAATSTVRPPRSFRSRSSGRTSSATACSGSQNGWPTTGSTPKARPNGRPKRRRRRGSNAWRRRPVRGPNDGRAPAPNPVPTPTST